ncbi:MAG: ABC transporter permease subunit [Sciscionella sp.]
MTHVSSSADAMSVTATARSRGMTQFGAVLGQGFRDRAGLSVSVAGLLVVMGLFVGALWPPLRSTFAGLPVGVLDTITTLLAGADLRTPSGWVNAELLSVLAPGGIIAVGVISTAHALAGEEDRNTLGVLLSAPLRRGRFLIAKTAATVLHVLVVLIGLALGLILDTVVGGLPLPVAGILGACAHAGLLGVLFVAVTVLICAATGRRVVSAATAGGLAALAFVLNVLLPLVHSVSTLVKADPWYYFAAADPLANGLRPAHLLVLAVTAVVVFGIAVAVYDRRDLRG